MFYSVKGVMCIVQVYRGVCICGAAFITSVCYISKMVFVILSMQHPEASSQELFADSQIHIWALEGEI